MESITFFCNHETCRKNVKIPGNLGEMTVAEHINYHAHLDKYAAEFWKLWDQTHSR